MSYFLRFALAALLLTYITVQCAYDARGQATAQRLTQPLTLNLERTVKLLGPIDANSLVVGAQIQHLAATPGVIYVLINSPGGVIPVGQVLMQVIREAVQAGRPVHCIVGGSAYSMAFYLLTACSHRSFLAETSLMFHGARVGNTEGFTEPDLKESLDYVQKFRARLLADIQASLGTKAKWVEEALVKERFFNAIELLQLVPSWGVIIPGITNLPTEGGAK